MNSLKIIVVTLFVGMLLGCSTTGGTIGGLIPAPKFLKGEINNSVYTSQDKSFSVATPYKQGTYSYKYMQVKEQTSPYGTYLSFGPAVSDSVYRIETAKRETSGSQGVDFDFAAQKTIENYSAQLQNGYGAPLHVITGRDEKLNGRKALFRKFSQIVPAGKYFSNQSTTLMHEVYVVDFEKNAVLVWVQGSEETMKNLPMDTRVFAESIVIH
jgi:hypothetical protein